MKSYKNMFIGRMATAALLLFGCFTTAAAEELSIEDFTIYAGQTKTIEVKMANTNAITGLELHFTLPEGLSIVTDATSGAYKVELSGRKAADHVALLAKKADNSYVVLSYSPTNKNFSLNEGTVATFQVTAAEDFDGDFKMHVSAVELAEATNVAHNPVDYDVNIEGKLYMLGDANHSLDITMSDANLVTNYFVTEKDNGLHKLASDVTKDGEITMSDANIIVNMFVESK